MIVDYTLATNNIVFNVFSPMFFWGPNVILSPKGLEKFLFLSKVIYF
jgi:hypothetical protein